MKPASSLKVGLVCSLLVSATGCNTVAGSDADPGASVVRPITEVRLKMEGRAKLAFGADCSDGLSPQCQSGICVHVGERYNAGYVCTIACGDSNGAPTRCPSSWRCVQMSSASNSGLCLPIQGI